MLFEITAGKLGVAPAAGSKSLAVRKYHIDVCECLHSLHANRQVAAPADAEAEEADTLAARLEALK